MRVGNLRLGDVFFGASVVLLILCALVIFNADCSVSAEGQILVQPSSASEIDLWSRVEDERRQVSMIAWGLNDYLDKLAARLSALESRPFVSNLLLATNDSLPSALTFYGGSTLGGFKVKDQDVLTEEYSNLLNTARRALDATSEKARAEINSIVKDVERARDAYVDYFN